MRKRKKFSERLINALTEQLSIVDALSCCAVNPTLTLDNIEEKTGWDPKTVPTEHQLNTWRTLAELM